MAAVLSLEAGASNVKRDAWRERRTRGFPDSTDGQSVVSRVFEIYASSDNVERWAVCVEV